MPCCQPSKILLKTLKCLAESAGKSCPWRNNQRRKIHRNSDAVAPNAIQSRMNTNALQSDSAELTYSIGNSFQTSSESALQRHNMNQNVDRKELEKFSELASRWWDPNSEFRPLHQINPLRLNWIDERSALAGKRVLDVGCGGGILSESMSERGADVVGIDLADAALSVARLHALETGAELEYLSIAAEDYAEEQAGTFDVVTCLEVLEHVPDPASTIAACAKLAKPGGTLYFSTINRNPKSWLFAIVGAEYVLKLLPKGTHEFNKFIRPSELETHCQSAGINVTEITGLTYNPLTKVYKLEKDIDVNYMMQAKKPDA